MMVQYTFLALQEGVLREKMFLEGLKPTWRVFRRYGSGEDLLPIAPPIREYEGAPGWYGFAWDSQLGGDTFGDISLNVPDWVTEPVVFNCVRETGVILNLSQKVFASPDQNPGG